MDEVKISGPKDGEIFQRITDAMREIEAIGKNKRNTAQNFNFRGIDDVYNGLHPVLAKNKLFTLTNVLSETAELKTFKSGAQLTYRVLKIQYTVYTSDGSSISGVVVGEGMDSGDKGANKAMAIAHKYFLMQLFAIPTKDCDDPDKDSPSVATPAATRPVQQNPQRNNINNNRGDTKKPISQHNSQYDATKDVRPISESQVKYLQGLLIQNHINETDFLATFGVNLINKLTRNKMQIALDLARKTKSYNNSAPANNHDDNPYAHDDHPPENNYDDYTNIRDYADIRGR